MRYRLKQDAILDFNKKTAILKNRSFSKMLDSGRATGILLLWGNSLTNVLFSDNATVIAADGTVMHMIGGSFITFSTKGWYSYKASNYGSTVTIKKMNEITISISTMIKWCGL